MESNLQGVEICVIVKVGEGGQAAWTPTPRLFISQSGRNVDLIMAATRSSPLPCTARVRSIAYVAHCGSPLAHLWTTVDSLLSQRASHCSPESGYTA